MMYRDYWVCPDCGAALDPDEKCNCHDRRPAAYCFMCAMPLYPEDALYDQDPAYERLDKSICNTKSIFSEIKRDMAEIEAILDCDDPTKLQEIITEARYRVHVLTEKLY